MHLHAPPTSVKPHHTVHAKTVPRCSGCTLFLSEHSGYLSRCFLNTVSTDFYEAKASLCFESHLFFQQKSPVLSLVYHTTALVHGGVDTSGEGLALCSVVVRLALCLATEYLNTFELVILLEERNKHTSHLPTPVHLCTPHWKWKIGFALLHYEQHFFDTPTPSFGDCQQTIFEVKPISKLRHRYSILTALRSASCGVYGIMVPGVALGQAA